VSNTVEILLLSASKVRSPGMSMVISASLAYPPVSMMVFSSSGTENNEYSREIFPVSISESSSIWLIICRSRSTLFAPAVKDDPRLFGDTVGLRVLHEKVEISHNRLQWCAKFVGKGADNTPLSFVILMASSLYAILFGISTRLMSTEGDPFCRILVKNRIAAAFFLI